LARARSLKLLRRAAPLIPSATATTRATANEFGVLAVRAEDPERVVGRSSFAQTSDATATRIHIAASRKHATLMERSTDAVTTYDHAVSRHRTVPSTKQRRFLRILDPSRTLLKLHRPDPQESVRTRHFARSIFGASVHRDQRTRRLPNVDRDAP
jgi:hypothetical protein